MILFSIIASLIGLAFALLFLPIRLLRLALNLVLLPVRIVIRLLTRNIFLCALLVIIVLVYGVLRDTTARLPQLTPAPATTLQGGAQPAVVIEPVLKREDGDSAFATDLYASMNDAERSAYSQHYYWAMSHLGKDEVHRWASNNINGALRAGDVFTNNSGVHCRHFSEVLKVHTIEQTITGIACEQGNGTWCKLKPNATPACGLGYSPGLLDSIKNIF